MRLTITTLSISVTSCKDFTGSAMNATMVRCTGRVSNGAAFGRRSHCNKVKAAAAAGRTSVFSASGRDYYKVLSLKHSADVGTEEIRRAYRRLALRYHPDACPPSRRAESTELFLELRRAYETLSNPALRVQYDAELRTTGEPASSPPQSGAFARDVWEAQLCMLRVRSESRQKARSGRRFQASPV